MKSKAPLPLMEQLIMVLVFALTAAVCLQGFTLANRMSTRQKDQSHAVALAQNAAELLKHTYGDFSQAATQLGGHWDGSAWSINYDADWQPLIPGALMNGKMNASSDLTTGLQKTIYKLQAVPVEVLDPLLEAAHIQVFYGREVLFEITVAWQEVTADETT